MVMVIRFMPFHTNGPQSGAVLSALFREMDMGTLVLGSLPLKRALTLIKPSDPVYFLDNHFDTLQTSIKLHVG